MEIELMTDRPAPTPAATIDLASEFAAVGVSLDTEGNGPRLRICNKQNGRAVYLDPLELASLTWLTHERLGPFLDPSQTGWREETNRDWLIDERKERSDGYSHHRDADHR
jgi:hypothetical protein